MPITTCSYGPFMRSAYGVDRKDYTQDSDEEGGDLGGLPGDVVTRRTPVPATGAAGAAGATGATGAVSPPPANITDLLKDPTIQKLVNQIQAAN